MVRLKRTLEFSYLIILIGAILIGRLFYLQVIQYKTHEETSLGIRSRIIPNIAPRGIIYDRFGKILAKNKATYYLYTTPQKIKDKKNLAKFIAKTCHSSNNLILQKLNNKSLPFEPLLIKKFLSFAELTKIEEHLNDYPSLVIATRITRDYPYKNVSSHVIGYTGEISARELKRKKGYRMNDIIGLAGVERIYDRYLRGVDGGEQIEVDPFGNPIKKIKDISLVPGNDLHLTIDIELSQLIDKLLNPYKGAVVVLDANSGEVLSLISKPDYNPNFFTDYLTEEEWREIQKNDHPLHNRALTGYPPASVFKIFTSVAALENKIFNPQQQYICKGALRIGGRRFGCWKTHGNINFYSAIVESCDVVFYRIGMLLDQKAMSHYASLFGLGTPTGIDLPFEGKGLIGNRKWKQKVYHQEWFPGDNLNMAIGQGFLLASPLQLAVAILPFANSQHQLYKPYVAKKVVNSDQETIFLNEPLTTGKFQIKESTYTFIQNALKDVVLKGTGKRANLTNFPIAGKTGTAETGKVKKNHAWFISYAPANDPEIVVTVFIEEGGSGGRIPAMISKQIYAWWHKNRSLYEGS